MQFIHTKYKNRSSCLGSNTKLGNKKLDDNTPTGIFSKISRARSMFLFFSVILASMIFRVRSMIFGRTFVAFPRYAFAILAFLATMSVFGFSASVFADSSSSAVYGDEGSVENSSNFSVTVEELNALELRLSASDLVLDLNPTSDAPVFGSSDLSVTVYTTNTTGYYLTMTPTYQSVATTNLTRTESLSGSYPTIATLSSTASPSTFASASDTTTSNKWGYKVNTTNLSTVDTTIYNPTIAASIPLNKTNTPINTGDETDITFAAKVDSETPAGSYKVDLNFTAITNANTYSITFNPGSASSDASLSGMPSPNPQTGALESGSSTSITLSSSTPTRAGYSFLGWCSVAPTTSNNTDSCSGTTYQPNSSITIYTDTPDIILYAMWDINSYAITITNSNTSSSVNSLTIPYGGSATVTVTPDSNYYLSDVSCPSGYTCSGYSTGISYTGQQTVTVTNNGTASGGTLSFTGTIAKIYLQNMTASLCTTTAQTAYDNRDEQAYTIQRLADGRCWMMTNLNLGAKTLSTNLTSSNTNLSSTVTYSTFNGWKKSRGSATYTSAEFIPVSGTDSTSGTAYGTLYNYCAASAGTICTSTNYSNASYDLCPAGWRLPTSDTGGEFVTLYANASYNTSAKMRASVANGGAAFAFAGSFGNSTPTNQGSGGYYWSSTRYSNAGMYRLALNTSSVYPSSYDNRSPGFSIRCILDDTLQGATYSSLLSKMPNVGDYTQLIDTRDGQLYTVAHFADGRFWMVDNLNLGATDLTTDLTNTNTNLSSTVTVSTFNGWKKTSGTGRFSSAEYIPLTASNTSNGLDTDPTSGTAYGTLYNYCAASAGTICTSTNYSNASYDLCPAGWRLPTGNTGGEFATLYANASYNTPSKMRASVANGGAAFAIAGGFYTNTPSTQGSISRYWSSTCFNPVSMYDLYVGTSYVEPDNSYTRSYGYSIRCILKATA